MAVSIVIYF